MAVEAFAPVHDASVLEPLLRAADLPVGDLDALDLSHFRIAGKAAAPAGAVGLEHLGDAGLLRSLVVAPSARGTGLGRRLVTDLERRATLLGVRDLWLLTETAEAFFTRLGYTVVDRAAAPAAIRGTREFASLCPDGAVCMTRRLGA